MAPALKELTVQKGHKTHVDITNCANQGGKARKAQGASCPSAALVVVVAEKQ